MNFRISIDLPAPAPLDGPLDQLFPRLALAVQAVARHAQEQWIAYASGAPLPDGRVIHTRTGTYARSIELDQAGALSWRVQSALPYADAIERGQPALDMKQWLRTSLKARVAKDGTRYLIIPFRHGTPGAVGFASVMPQHIHEAAKALTASRVTGTAKVPNQIGAYSPQTRELIGVERRTYSWGERLPEGLVGKSREHHKTDRFAGLVRFNRPAGGGDDRGGGHSQYLTFRVMSEKSSGWQRGPVPGYWPARTVSEQLGASAEGLMREAMGQDMAAIIAGSAR